MIPVNRVSIIDDDDFYMIRGVGRHSLCAANIRIIKENEVVDEDRTT